MEEWIKIFNELGYLGFSKKKKYQEFNQRFGQDNWLVKHFLDDQILNFVDACLQYEESYYQHFKNNPDLRKWIINTASEVYDIQESNIESRLDYTNQECDAIHLQDIAVRRALIRLKLEDEGIDYNPNNLPDIPIFKGDHPVQIRGHKTEGFPLNPGQVPFHKPELILDTAQDGWWKQGSAEDFYQKNKVLLVNPESFEVKLAIVNQSNLFFEFDKNSYYKGEYSKQELSDSLIKIKGKNARSLYSQKENNGFIEVRDSPVKSYSEWREIFPDINIPYKNEKQRINFGDL